MFQEKDIKKISFFTVSLAIILSGCAIVSFGITTWLFNYYAEGNYFASPSQKVIGGIIIIALGYIQLGLELSREKK